MIGPASAGLSCGVYDSRIDAFNRARYLGQTTSAMVPLVEEVTTEAHQGAERSLRTERHCPHLRQLGDVRLRLFYKWIQ